MTFREQMPGQVPINAAVTRKVEASTQATGKATFRLQTKKGGPGISTIHRAPEAPNRASPATQVAASVSVSYDGPKSPQHEETEQDRKRHRNLNAMGV